MSAHAMPFGAEALRGGGVRFRLWAPAAKKVDLVLNEKVLPLEGSDDGFFEKTVPTSQAGDLYRYRIDGGTLVPDPASRFQPQDVHGPSEVVDPSSFEWNDSGWKGRPWNEAVIYELHVGAFTPGGNYRSIIAKIEHLKSTGVTALELMPLSDFPGRRNWGYDGVLPYAPDSSYGRPEELKALVQAAHGSGLMVFLDVVYNHFGPDGNYLFLYAPQFFTGRYDTPWGAAINFDGEGSRWVREYFIHNALYWLEEYRFDGLRFDAVHAIHDSSKQHVLNELVSRVKKQFPQKHLILENDANQARFLGEGGFTAQWNDDSHHAFHVLATGESDGYYAAYAEAPAKHLARCLAEGFSYQGEISPFSGKKRGEPCAHLGPLAFVDFMQNHDQIGNRALGERLLTLSSTVKVKALTAILLLAPSPPMLFMGEEWGCRQPFLFFCDFAGDLAEAVRRGRREEFKRFSAFGKDLPDPLGEETFRRCVLRWQDEDEDWFLYMKELLEVRKKAISSKTFGAGTYRMMGERAFEVSWPGGLRLIANCGDAAVEAAKAAGNLWSNAAPGAPWSVNWHLG